MNVSDHNFCTICTKVFANHADLRNHLTVVHNVELLTEKLTFDTEEDFTKWKKDVEEQQHSSYVYSGDERLQDGSIVQYFACHRSYEFRSSRLKSTNKTGKACPAGFRVNKCADGKIVVEACHTHLGHSKPVGGIFSTGKDREKIAEKLQEGGEVERISGFIRNYGIDDYDDRFHAKKRKRMHQRHQRSLYITSHDISSDTEDDPDIPVDTFCWLVDSCSSPGTSYTVQLKNLSCPKSSCEQKCELCDICVHQFKCSCPDHAEWYNLCKHIHAVKRCYTTEIDHYNLIEVIEVDVTNVTVETLQLLQAEIEEEKENKRRIQALLENMLAQIAEQHLAKKTYKILENELRNCQTIINDGRK